MLARHSRKYGYSNIYHVMIRGNNKMEIFYDDEDCRKFLKILEENRKKWNFYLLAYCLMVNHVHLLIFDPNKELASIMKCIDTSYAIFFNRKYDRVGYLFQNRFKSKCVNDVGYLERVIKYIHQNPVKAFICDVDEYKWSSFNEYSKLSDNIDYQVCFDLLGYENLKLEEALKNFIDFNMIKTYNYEEEADCEFEKFLTDENAYTTIKEVLYKNSIESILDISKKERNCVIRKIKKIKCISNRQIADFFNLSRDLVAKL